VAKKGGKSKDKGEKAGFTFAGIDIPAALKGSGVTVDNLTKHPLVAGLAAMALESLASQIRAKTAATSAATPPQPEPTATRKPAAARASVAKKPSAKKAASPKPAAKKPVTRKPAAKSTSTPKPKPAA
jgi:outer membrane biosynthesis protein TonB